MTYKILKMVSSSTTEYWQFVINTDGSVYSTTDLVVLEAKLKEILVNTVIGKIKVINEVEFTEDLIFA